MRIILILVLLMTASLRADELPGAGDFPPLLKAVPVPTQLSEAEALIKRRVPAVAGCFQVQAIAAENGHQVFEVETPTAATVILRGSNGVAVATGLNWYLKHCCNRQLSWCGSNMDMQPGDLKPVPGGHQRIVMPHLNVVYMNYCTLSYSMAWWDWERWQWEIDYMAMNGVTMPLGMVGLEAVWYRALLRMGLSDEEARTFLVGPAYFAWEWMANIENHCGPLPKSWIDSHAILGRQILDRERALGMTPIQQGFSGHVPLLFKQRFPQASIAIKEGWCNFPGTAQLDPLDPLFARFGRIFLEEEARIFGLGGYYAADPFHESSPPRPGDAYLTQVGEAIHHLFDSVDPHSVWVMQSWSIRKEIAVAVPKRRLLVVDLTGQVWNKTDGFWGHDFIVGQLHNFGGRLNLHGDLNVLAQNPFSSAHQRYPDTAQGMGLFMEGIIQNPVFYDLFFDLVWNDHPVDLGHWLTEYVQRRYGVGDGPAVQAWNVLRATAYGAGSTMLEGSSIVAARPALNVRSSGPSDGFQTYYDPQEMAQAWDLLLADNERCAHADGYRFDVVDVGRQVLSNLGQVLHQDLRAAFTRRDLPAFEQASARFLELLGDIDRLCETRPEYRFGDWLHAAQRWGTSQAESALYAKNASMLVTLWGPQDEPTLFDYSWREWSGLIRSYYIPRWARFHDYLAHLLATGGSYSEPGLPEAFGHAAWRANDFYKGLATWETAWVLDPKTDWKALPVTPGDEVTIAIALHKKWQPLAEEAYARELQRHLAEVAKLPKAIGLGQLLWEWKPLLLGDDWREVTIPLPPIPAGSACEVLFTYLSGASALEIDTVALTCNGTEVMHDAHRGWTGNEDRANVYLLKIDVPPAGTSYALKARIKGSGSRDSTGVVSIRMSK